MPTITAVISDTHIGGSTALALPKFENDEGQVITASNAQQWLYECWCDYWTNVYKLTKKHWARLVVIHLGDVLDGNHHQTVQALPNLQDQRRMAFEILEPIRHKADQMIMLRGTQAHAGEAAQDELSLATELGADLYWHALIDIDGLVLDLAHHPNTIVAETLARRAQYTAMEEGNPIPRYILRGDRHIIKDSGAQVMNTRAMILPAWQLHTGFGYKVASGTRSDIGGLIILPDGTLNTDYLRYKAPGGVGRKVMVY